MANASLQLKYDLLIAEKRYDHGIQWNEVTITRGSERVSLRNSPDRSNPIVYKRGETNVE